MDQSYSLFLHPHPPPPSPIVEECTSPQFVSAIIGWGRFGTFRFLLQPIPDCIVCTQCMLFLALVHCEILLDIFKTLFKYLIIYIICQGSINYLLFITYKCFKRRKRRKKDKKRKEKKKSTTIHFTLWGNFNQPRLHGDGATEH